jgi:peptidoglycan/xylan/chitin deacetylase (PgdA/CDA1 family)
MPEIARKAGDIVNRLSNRLIRRFGSRPRTIGNDARLISFTFDDVPQSALDAGAVILEKYGVHGTFYVAGGLLGKVEMNRPVITLEGCRELARRGHEIGSHTFAHKPLRRLWGRRLADDLDRNAACLEQATGLAAPENFAFPFNAAWPMARPTLRRRFRSCRAAGRGINRGPVDPMMLKSIAIEGPDTEARALTRTIDELVRNPGWLIFFCHDVSDSPSPYGCTPEAFELLVRHAVESGCEVVTVSRALDRLGW